MLVTAAELIASIRGLLESQEPLPERISSLTAYSESFDQWYGEHKEELEKMSPSREAVELLELHNQLISAAEGWLKDVGAEIGIHRKKGKGIMAYTDILPKRVSRYQTKKG